MDTLSGQVALVTGAGSGIGRACAERLAGAGVRVVLNGRRKGPLREAQAACGGADAALVSAGDVAELAACERAVAAAVDRWGRLDIVVNSAGTNMPRRLFADMTAEDWRTIIDINLHGAYHVTRAALPQMRSQGRGTIVQICSAASIRPGLVGGVHYSAAKAAQLSLVRSVNVEEQPHGIRACAIMPGEVVTPILELRPQPPSAERRADMLLPEDVAETVLLACALPQRAVIEELLIRPRQTRH
jgi:NADP-dependent 3-hydroxy acid dehydrogenase YdfG